MVEALGRFLFVGVLGFFVFFDFFFLPEFFQLLSKNLTVVPAHSEPGV